MTHNLCQRRLTSTPYQEMAEYRNIYSCLVCMRTFTNPRILDCGHIFCEQCLLSYYSLFRSVECNTTQGVGLPCPTCRKLTAAPVGGPAPQPTPNSRLRDRKVSRGANESLLKCDSCTFNSKSEMAEFYCSKCSLNLCRVCRSIHDQHALFKEHVIIHVTSQESLDLYCDKHRKMPSYYFCVDCNVPSCAVCMLHDHAEHTAVKLREALGKRRDYLKTLLNEFGPRIDKLEMKYVRLVNLYTVPIDDRHSLSSDSVGKCSSGDQSAPPRYSDVCGINGTRSEQTDHSLKITKLIKNALPLKHSDTVGDGDDESTSSKNQRNGMRRSSSSPGTGLTGSWFNGLMSVMHLTKESSSDGNGKIKTKHRRGSGHGNGSENQLKPLSDWNRKLSHNEIMEDSEMVDDDAGLHRLVPSEDLLTEKKAGSGRKSVPASGKADLGPRPTIAKLCEFTSGSDSTIDESTSKNMEACNLFKTQIARHRKLFDLSTKTLDMSQSKKLFAIYEEMIGRIQTVLEAELGRIENDLDKTITDEQERKRHSTGSDYGNFNFDGKIVHRGSGEASSGTETGGLHFEVAPLSMLVRPKLLWRYEKSRSDISETSSPVDVAFMPDDETTVVAEYDNVTDKNNKLQLFDKTGKNLGFIAQGQVQPLGVAVTRDSHIAVTDCKFKRVKIYTTTGQAVTEIGKGQFGWPYGIAVNSRGQLIITDVFTDNVSIYSPDGKRTKTFGETGSQPHQFRNPYHVTVDSRDNIIVSDSSNNCVKVFDPSGKFQFCTFEASRRMSSPEANNLDRKMKRRKLHAPKGVTIDRKGNILVADDYCRVCMFDASGKFVRNLLTEEDSVKYPEAVNCSSGGLLSVTEFNPNNMFAVKMFRLYE